MSTITIETFVLVAVWHQPFIYQGCFRITEISNNHSVCFFFRCESNHLNQQDILINEFSFFDYDFTHLYNEYGIIDLTAVTQLQEDALYLLTYALHHTLQEMITKQKIHVTSFDDTAMQIIINKVTPLLSRELTLPEDDHIGFAVIMDFSPQEETGHRAVLALLNGLLTNNKILN